MPQIMNTPDKIINYALRLKQFHYVKYVTEMPLHATDNEKKLKVITVMSLTMFVNETATIFLRQKLHILLRHLAFSSAFHSTALSNLHYLTRVCQ